MYAYENEDSHLPFLILLILQMEDCLGEHSKMSVLSLNFQSPLQIITLGLFILFEILKYELWFSGSYKDC